MYDNFKVANYDKALLSPELYARPLARLFSGDVIDGLTVVPGTGLQVTLQPGNALVRYGATKVASARIVSLVDNFNLAIGAPDGSNPRNDLVVLYIDNSVSLPSTDPPTSANLDGPGVAKAKIVAGTPNSSPTDPTSGAIQSAVGSGNPYTVVARVRVDTGVSVIASGKITDMRSVVQLPPSLIGGLQKVALSVTNSGSFTVNADVYSLFGGKFVGGYIQVTGGMTTSEQKAGTINLPGSASNLLYRGGTDGTGSRTGAAFINTAGEIYVQGQESFSGSFWFTFFSAM